MRIPARPGRGGNRPAPKQKSVHQTYTPHEASRQQQICSKEAFVAKGDSLEKTFMIEEVSECVVGVIL